MTHSRTQRKTSGFGNLGTALGGAVEQPPLGLWAGDLLRLCASKDSQPRTGVSRAPKWGFWRERVESEGDEGMGKFLALFVDCWKVDLLRKISVDEKAHLVGGLSHGPYVE